MAEPTDPKDAPRVPQLVLAPPIPTTTEFTDAAHVRDVVNRLDRGEFRLPALLVERMLWNPRFRAVMGTRLAGLVSTKVRFKARKNTKARRKAAEAFERDWPRMLPSATRKQMLKWALLLGAAFGQRSLLEQGGRFLPRLRSYWPGFAFWYWPEQCYRIQTFNKGLTPVASPEVDWSVVERNAFSAASMKVPAPGESAWVVCEPFGDNSYRDGLVHAAWRPWLGHDWAMRDQARASQKHGVGVFGLEYPQGTGKEHQKAVERYQRGLQTMDSEGVIPMERRDDGTGFGVKPIEFNGTGFQAISDTLGANAVALAILLLGHNLTTEIKNGGSYAAAGVANYIRDDVKYEDGATEWGYAGPQLAEPWGIWNYGDPEAAPLAEYETDSAAITLARAQMFYQLSMALEKLRTALPSADLEALAQQFDLPILLAPAGAVQVPAGEPPPAPPIEDEEEPLQEAA